MIANTDGGVSPQSWNRSGRVAVAMGTARHDALEAALERTRDWLLERQEEEGYWVAELEGDTILESEYVLLMTFLGRESDDPVCIRCVPLYPGPSAARRRLGDLSGRPDRRRARRSRRTSRSS